MTLTLDAVKKTTLAVLLGLAPQALAAGELELSLSPADHSAAKAATARFQHAKAKAHTVRPETSASLRIGGLERHLAIAGNGAARSPVRYPGTLDNHGGPVLTSTVQHGIFVNPTAECPISGCWGDPLGFLADLNHSDFIHVTDQYVGTNREHRYPVGDSFALRVAAPATPMTDDDMAAFAHAAAAASGQSGYGHIFHIFLPPGQDVCFDSSYGACYSPDVPPTFAFCAYHSSADFADVGHVVYSVEPWQGPGSGCEVTPGTPNGSLIDSTNNVLSHELIEAITDPDGNAWFNSTNLVNYGEEIADECSFLDSHFFYDPSPVRLGGKLYAVQPEYSNATHACVTGTREGEEHRR